jgi:hypothetical protein
MDTEVDKPEPDQESFVKLGINNHHTVIPLEPLQLQDLDKKQITAEIQ